MKDDQRAELEEIKERLVARFDILARGLFPGGVTRGGYYFPVNIMRSDRQPGSFMLRISGKDCGRWKEHNPCGTHPSSGGPIDLIMLRYGCDFKQALGHARRFLNMPEREQKARMARVNADMPEQTIKAGGWGGHEDPRSDEEKQASWLKWWSGCARLPGTLGEVYLRDRGINISQLEQLPGAVRFVPQLKYFHSDGSVTRHPALLTAMSDGQGKLKALHRTYLADDGKGKAALQPAKKMIGRGRGTSMRLARGARGKSVSAALAAGIKDEHLLITEGLENGLVAALLWPECRVAAAGSLSLIASCPIPQTVRRVTVLGDRDRHDPDGETLESHVQTLQQSHPGIRFGVRLPDGFGDLNDLWKEYDGG